MLKKRKRKFRLRHDEIEEHRNYYGSLSEQLPIFMTSMSNGLMKLKYSGNNQLEAALIKERDIKIADIEKNFESDEHVADKIRAEKEVDLESILMNIKDTGLAHFSNRL